MELDAAPMVELQHNVLLLGVRPGTDMNRKREVLAAWYTGGDKTGSGTTGGQMGAGDGRQGREAVRPGDEDQVGQLQSRHRGSPSQHGAREETARMPRVLSWSTRWPIFLEPTHGQRFVDIMDHLMPNWRFYRDELNLCRSDMRIGIIENNMMPWPS